MSENIISGKIEIKEKQEQRENRKRKTRKRINRKSKNRRRDNRNEGKIETQEKIERTRLK